MGKAYEPPLCIDCVYYEATGSFTSGHLCNRLVSTGYDLVTGGETTNGVNLNCREERYKLGEQYCGKVGRFFVAIMP
jgi:hypothetical protein